MFEQLTPFVFKWHTIHERSLWGLLSGISQTRDGKECRAKVYSDVVAVEIIKKNCAVHVSGTRLRLGAVRLDPMNLNPKTKYN